MDPVCKLRWAVFYSVKKLRNVSLSFGDFVLLPHNDGYVFVRWDFNLDAVRLLQGPTMGSIGEEYNTKISD